MLVIVAFQVINLLLNLYAKLPSVVAVHLCVCEQPRIWDGSLAIVASICITLTDLINGAFLKKKKKKITFVNS